MLLFFLWVLSVPFSRYSLVGSYSLDNLLVLLLPLLALFLPAPAGANTLRGWIVCLIWSWICYLIFATGWTLHYFTAPELLKERLFGLIKDVFYFSVPLLYLRNRYAFKRMKGILILLAIMAALSAILASLGVIHLPADRFEASRIGVEWLPKAIGLFSSYGDVAMLYSVTAVLLISHDRAALPWGLGRPIIKLAIWSALLVGLIGNQSRNVLLTTLAAMAIYMAIRILEKEEHAKNRLLLVSFAVAGLLVLLGLVVVFGQDMVSEVSQLGGTGAAGTAKARLGSYQQAIGLIAREPWLGISLETYQTWGPLAEGIHNMWLKIMLNGGFLSLLAMLALLWRALRGVMGTNLGASAEFYRDRAMIAALLASLLLASQFYGGMTSVWWILLGVVISFGWLRWQYEAV